MDYRGPYQKGFSDDESSKDKTTTFHRRRSDRKRKPVLSQEKETLPQVKEPSAKKRRTPSATGPPVTISSIEISSTVTPVQVSQASKSSRSTTNKQKKATKSLTHLRAPLTLFDTDTTTDLMSVHNVVSVPNVVVSDPTVLEFMKGVFASSQAGTATLLQMAESSKSSLAKISQDHNSIVTMLSQQNNTSLVGQIIEENYKQTSTLVHALTDLNTSSAQAVSSEQAKNDALQAKNEALQEKYMKSLEKQLDDKSNSQEKLQLFYEKVYEARISDLKTAHTENMTTQKGTADILKEQDKQRNLFAATNAQHGHIQAIAQMHQAVLLEQAKHMYVPLSSSTSSSSSSSSSYFSPGSNFPMIPSLYEQLPIILKQSEELNESLSSAMNSSKT